MMDLMEKHTKRLSLYICQATYDRLHKTALKEGRKAGSLARHLLDRWAESADNHDKHRRENI